MASAMVVDIPAAAADTDIGSMLAGLSKTAPAGKSKSKVPVVAGFEQAADDAAEKKRAFKQAETELAMAEEALLPAARAQYAERARRGNFTKSLSFAGRKTAGVRVSFQDRFSVMPVEVKGDLVDAIGEEKYATLFNELRSLSLKKTDDGSIRFLLERLGPEVFTEFFEVKVEIKPKDGFDQRQFELPDVMRDLARQAKPSVTAL